MMDVDEIIKLVDTGADFGAMAEIRTLIDEIKRLRAELAAKEPGAEYAQIKKEFDEMSAEVKRRRNSNRIEW